MHLSFHPLLSTEPGEAQAKAAALATALIPALSAASLEALRFNWDLATQPAFASAPETSYGAAVPEWWARSGSERGGAQLMIDEVELRERAE